MEKETLDVDSLQTIIEVQKCKSNGYGFTSKATHPYYVLTLPKQRM